MSKKWKKISPGPTQRILSLARKSAGGIIRWSDARDEYVLGSEYAQYLERKMKNKKNGRNYHMSLKRVLDRHFETTGERGLYIIKDADSLNGI